MARLQILAFITLLMAAKVHSRSIRLSSDEAYLQARSVVDFDHLELNSSILVPKAINSTERTCTHYYGFLPCATNIPGYIFQILILEYLLLVGDRILTSGRQQIFSILGVGIYGATIFRFLQALPTIVLVLASGIAQNKEAAQVRVENGVATLAGSTVFYLTLQWGICVLLGRTKIIKKSSKAQPSSTIAGCSLIKLKLSTFKVLAEDGVETDKKTSYTAKIMLLSLIPLIMVEVTDTFKSRPWSHIFTLTVSVAALVSYFVFVSRHQWIQERSLEYSRDQLLLAGFLDHLQKFAKKKLVNAQGQADASCIGRAFDEIDEDADNKISKAELEKFLAKMMSGFPELDKKIFTEHFMKHFDGDSDDMITKDEFLAGCEKFLSEAQTLVTDKDASTRRYFPGLYQMLQPCIDRSKKNLSDIEKLLSVILNAAQNEQLDCLLTDGKPDDAKIRSLFDEGDKDNDGKITVGELQGMIMNKFNDLNDDFVMKTMKTLGINNEDGLPIEKFTDTFKKRLSEGANNTQFDKYLQKKKRDIKQKTVPGVLKALLRVVSGIAIVSSLGMPLVNNTQLLSDSIGIPAFFVSFVVLPLAVNFKTVMAKILPASQKKEGASSIMFSEIYGEVFMNNILGLLTLVGVIWARGFKWVYSAELLVLLAVSAIIGVIGARRIRYPLWTCVLAFSLYPLSLVLFYIIRYIVGWK